MTGIAPNCSHCGRPIIHGAVYFGVGVYHTECTRGPEQPMPQWTIGCICPPTSEQTCRSITCPRRSFAVDPSIPAPTDCMKET